jgi:hypothetical protein
MDTESSRRLSNATKAEEIYVPSAHFTKSYDEDKFAAFNDDDSISSAPTETTVS